MPAPRGSVSRSHFFSPFFPRVRSLPPDVTPTYGSVSLLVFPMRKTNNGKRLKVLRGHAGGYGREDEEKFKMRGSTMFRAPRKLRLSTRRACPSSSSSSFIFATRRAVVLCGFASRTRCDIHIIIWPSLRIIPNYIGYLQRESINQ